MAMQVAVFIDDLVEAAGIEPDDDEPNPLEDKGSSS
jgi:hypothetical protein